MNPAPTKNSVGRKASETGRGTVVRARNTTLTFGGVHALRDVSLSIPSGCMVGLVGPDGVGKSSLLSLITGSRAMQKGELEVLSGNISEASHRREICPKIAYMPQGLGKNLYATLSVFENVDFFARLFGQNKKERADRIARLLKNTGLSPFADRPAGKLSGGMKQKLGLCCSLIHDPELLILDEPTTGVDPLSRQQFWELVEAIRSERRNLSVIVATAYMEEAARFDWVVAMNAGEIIGTGTPSDLMAKTGVDSFDAAFIALLPEAVSRGHVALVIPPRDVPSNSQFAIEASHLSMRFGNFTAVDDVSFKIPTGEIFGFLGSNGCGKTTTMKMLTGLLVASEGEAKLFGRPVVAEDLALRRRIGYMSQAFSLYSELTVRQNLKLNGRLFQLSPDEIVERISELSQRLGLDEVLDVYPNSLPLGIRQRLSLAAALIHSPDILILDEPTSGVDPIARDAFWQILLDLSRKESVTIFISTHFMNEAERCDRIALMHAGKVLITDTPKAIVERHTSATLEEAFIAILEEAAGPPSLDERPQESSDEVASPPSEVEVDRISASLNGIGRFFNFRRMYSYTWRETLELRRDPIRATLAILGSVILMFVIGYGINMDVEDLTFAVLDRDDTTVSRDYVLDISGSRYFIEKEALIDYADLDERMRDGDITLALEIPPGFGRMLMRGDSVEIGAWVDGSMPQRAETIRGYVQGMHTGWLTRKAAETAGSAAIQPPFSIETRFRYNPDVKSLVAIVPAVIPLLLMLIPAMLAALSVVREKELGSIINLYVTPVTRLEFLFGKQIPYIALGMISFFLLVAFAVLVFQVRFTGSLFAYTTAALLYVVIATSIGILMSTFMKSQVAAIFGTALLTLIPATQYSGMIDPVSSLQGAGAFIGSIYPTTHFMTISRGTFSKGLDFNSLANSFVPLLLAIPVLATLGASLLKKQET